MERRCAAPTAGAAGRFLALGGTNTVMTAAAYYALSSVLDPALAFTLVYFAGLTLVTLVTPRWVFGTRPAARRRGALAAWYLGVYVVGLGVTRVLDRGLEVDHLLVVLGTILVTAPLGFIGGWLLVGSRATEAA